MPGLTKSATDLIIQAMEAADEMAECIVVYRLKDHSESEPAGFGWVSNTDDTELRAGMLESAKWGMIHKSYSRDGE